MRYSFWPDGSYPIFINPEIPEVVELAKSGWDTVRICVEEEVLAIASGYGNTHQSVIEAVSALLKPKKRFFPETYILFREEGDFWFNLEDVSGQRKAHYFSVIKQYFNPDHAAILRDLVQMSGG